jgi:hypothetical protein
MSISLFIDQVIKPQGNIFGNTCSRSYTAGNVEDVIEFLVNFYMRGF